MRFSCKPVSQTSGDIGGARCFADQSANIVEQTLVIQNDQLPERVVIPTLCLEHQQLLVKSSKLPRLLNAIHYWPNFVHLREVIPNPEKVQTDLSIPRIVDAGGKVAGYLPGFML
jgi:hypothetical protein